MLKTSERYRDALKRARQLSRTEHLRLIESLTMQHRAKKNHKKHNILELEGLGKEIWRGIDAPEYVQRERAWVG